MGWKLLTNPPKESGQYIVAHRGYAEIIWFISQKNKEVYHPTTKFGWRSDPRKFGATHYIKLPEITLDQWEHANADLYDRGLSRVVNNKDIVDIRVPS